MLKKIIVFVAIITSITILVQCSDQGSVTKPKFTMAQDSELTLLMREMYAYYDSIRVDINNDALSSEIKTFADIHKAVATSPEKSSSELYKGMADIYLSSAKRINLPGTDKKKSFNIMIDNCMSCHQQMCPGPMVKIKKLYLK